MSNADYAMLLFYAPLMEKKKVMHTHFCSLPCHVFPIIPVLHHCGNMFIGIP